MLKLKRNVCNQKGFTLVEIAIVMVIIGLLIGGILKGQEMLKNAKVKRIAKQADGLRAAVFSYQDRFGALPGDDPAAQTHTGDGTLANGNGNGLIAAGEDEDVFAHLAASGLISGSAADYQGGNFPTHPFGGTTIIVNTTVQGKASHWINLSNIPADVGRMIDSSQDDGVHTTGSIRADAAYVNDTVVTLSIEL